MITSPDKLLFPADGITKKQVVEYYEMAAPRMIEHIAGRPLTLQRFPRGIGEKGFMQKNAPDHLPPSIERVEVPKVDGGVTRYPVLRSIEDIPLLANLNTITFHTWMARTPELDKIDRLVFDLDPVEGDVAGARTATLLVKQRLADLDLQCAVMTTGSKGYHVIVGITPTDGDATGRFAWGIAKLLAADNEDAVTDEFRIAKRRSRVFVDWLRNRPGATGVAPWSLRPLPGAPIAMPIDWEELPTTEPRRWHLATAGERSARPDPVALHCEQPQDITQACRIVADELAGRDIELAAFDRFRG